MKTAWGTMVTTGRDSAAFATVSRAEREAVQANLPNECSGRQAAGHQTFLFGRPAGPTHVDYDGADGQWQHGAVYGGTDFGPPIPAWGGALDDDDVASNDVAATRVSAKGGKDAAVPTAIYISHQIYQSASCAAPAFCSHQSILYF